MTRSRRGLALFIALLGLAAFASSADAKAKQRHTPAPERAAPSSRSDFPIYMSRGVDRNPGGDNLYFQDTKRPNYIVGPGFLGYINNSTTFGPAY